MPPFPLALPDRVCEWCDGSYNRSRRPCGRLEAPHEFKYRRFCSKSCSAKWTHQQRRVAMPLAPVVVAPLYGAPWMLDEERVEPNAWAVRVAEELGPHVLGLVAAALDVEALRDVDDSRAARPPRARNEQALAA